MILSHMVFFLIRFLYRSANNPTTPWFVVVPVSNYYGHDSSIPAARSSIASWFAYVGPDVPNPGN